MAGEILPWLASGFCCDWCKCLFFSYLNRLLGSLGEQAGRHIPVRLLLVEQTFLESGLFLFTSVELAAQEEDAGQLQQQHEGQAERPAAPTDTEQGGPENSAGISRS